MKSGISETWLPVRPPLDKPNDKDDGKTINYLSIINVYPTVE